MFTKSKIPREQILALSLLGLICLSPLYHGGSPYPALAFLRLGILILATIMILKIFRDGLIEFPKSRVYYFVFIFFVFVVGTTIASIYKNISIEWMLTLLMYVFFFAVTIILFKEKELIIKGLTVLFLFSVCEAFFGLIQYFFMGFDRAKGTFFNPNYFAGFLIPALLVGCSLLLFSVKDFNISSAFNLKSKYSRYIIAFIFTGVGLMILALFLSGSRGAVLSFLGGFFALMVARFKIKGMIVLSLFLVVFYVTPNPVVDRFLAGPSEDVTTYSRIGIWERSVQIAFDYPMGIGMGMFKYYWPQYNFPIENTLSRYGIWSLSPHNEYLQIAVELGIGALIIFIGGLLFFIGDVWNTLKKNNLGDYHPIFLGLGCGVIGVLVHACVDSNLHEPSIGIQFAFICGLMLCLKKMALLQEVYRFRFTRFQNDLPRFFPVSVWVITLLISIVLIRPLVAYGYSVMGTRSLEKGEIDRSVHYLDLSTWWDPGKTQYHSMLAAAVFQKYLESNEVKWVNDSNFELNYARYLNPQNESFPRQLGYVYSIIAMRTLETEIKEYLFSVSLDYYKQAIRLNPYQPNSFHELGKIYFQIGDVRSAEKSFVQAKNLEPNFLPARLSLGDIYVQKGKIREAQQEYMQILSTLKIYANVTGLTPLEQQFLEIDNQKMKGLKLSLQGKI